MTINCIHNFQNDTVLREELFNLAKPSYKDPTAVLAREYKNNQTIYLLRNKSKELIAFFMSGVNKFDDLEINYLGLACVKDEYKNTGLIMKLFIRGLEDAIHNNLPRICWLTTPSTQIFKMIHCILDFVNPSVELGYSADAIAAASKINSSKGYNHESENPFVLRGVAELTQYSAEEQSRINHHKKDRASELFEKANINEQNGDRMIMVCNLPDIEKLTDLKRRFKYLEQQ